MIKQNTPNKPMAAKVFKVAAIQMKAAEDPIKNRVRALKLLEDGIRRKARLLALPEMFVYRGPASGLKKASGVLGLKFFEPFADLAKKHSVWILLGGYPERARHGEKYWNTSLLLDSRGRVAAKYRKIHLFKLSEGARDIVDETLLYLKGQQPVMVRIDRIAAGFSTCFDLRFPELFRGYRARGADLFLCPSAFTRKTGQDHWKVLIRARAIENQCFMIAPNQYGPAGDGIFCHGHSLIVDPWGRVLAEGPADQDAVLLTGLDLSRLKEIRKELPCEPKIRYK